MVKSHIASKEQLISNKDKYYFIFLAGLFLVLMSYLGAAWADNASLGKTQQEKEEYRERVRRWEQLEPKKRAAILKNFEQYRKLSSEEKQRIQENWQKWKQLPPEEKKEIRAREKQWKKL
ncbi:MAG: DUF3106 domain-containing protein, partial [Candidatus Omnitrophica bacterium]|nr:DUF3106 domain-containing protein [Candidatus Omnitrophota bacterium]